MRRLFLLALAFTALLATLGALAMGSGRARGGDVLAFVGTDDGALYLLDVNTRVLWRAAREGQYPAWSPDGGTLASVAGTCLLLYTPPAPPRCLTPPGEAYPNGLAWSPDGTALAVTVGDALLRYDVARAAWESLLTLPGIGTTAADPVWSRDGLRVGFRRGGVGDDQMVMLTLNPTAGALKTSEDDAVRLITRDGLPGALPPVWSPSLYRALIATPNSGWLYVLDVPRDAYQRLVQLPPRLQAAAWSPNGGSIAAASSAADGIRVYRLSAPPNPGVPRLLATLPPGEVAALVWSLDGARLALLARDGTSAGALYVVTLADGTFVRLMTRAGEYAALVWRR